MHCAGFDQSFDQSVVSELSNACYHKRTVFSNIYRMLLCVSLFFLVQAQLIFFRLFCEDRWRQDWKADWKITASMFIPFKSKMVARGRKGGGGGIYRVYNMTLCAIEASYHLNPSKMTCRFCKGVTPMMCSVLCIWITRIIYTPPQLQPRCRPPCLPLLSQASSWALDLARPSQHSVSHLSDRCLPPKQWVIIELHLSGCTHLVWSAAFLLLFLVMAWHPQSA